MNLTKAAILGVWAVIAIFAVTAHADLAPGTQSVNISSIAEAGPLTGSGATANSDGVIGQVGVIPGPCVSEPFNCTQPKPQPPPFRCLICEQYPPPQPKPQPPPFRCLICEQQPPPPQSVTADTNVAPNIGRAVEEVPLIETSPSTVSLRPPVGALAVSYTVEFQPGATIDFADATQAKPGPLRGHVWVKLQGEYVLIPVYRPDTRGNIPEPPPIADETAE